LPHGRQVEDAARTTPMMLPMTMALMPWHGARFQRSYRRMLNDKKRNIQRGKRAGRGLCRGV
ncbi:MAG: hypothetical protein RSC96_09570, partial [Oscillospiraceae bacterium]